MSQDSAVPRPDELPGLDLQALGGYLREQGVDVAGELRATLLQGGRSNLTYRVRDEGSHDLVVRRPPTAGLTPSAHDMAREWAVTSGLQGTEVPVAGTVAFCEDVAVMGAPFTVVDHLSGRVVRLSSEVDELTDAQVQACSDELVRVLVALHAVDQDAVGLGSFGKPDGYVRRQVATWKRQWGHVHTRELPELDRLHAALESRVPEHSAASIVHGDYRIDNTILAADDPGRVLAVVDWEMATLGDPLSDLATMCVYKLPFFNSIHGNDTAATNARWPSTDAVVEAYASASGRDLGDWDFYLALACFKIAVIAEGILFRAQQGAQGGGDVSAIASVVPQFIDEGLRTLG